MNGALRVGPPSGGAGGIAPTTCEIDHIDPINIPSIGYVCVQPAPGCPLGEADCDAGTALGVDLRANGNVGACTSPTTGNADCADTCASFCAGTGRNYRSSGCTGRCSDSERGCTDDDTCSNVDEGSCNGPDPVSASQKNICQCQCINLGAGAPGGAGELQCQLGANINVESNAPCGDGDIKVAIGRTCIPLTTATAATQVNNANFSANSVPSRAPASNTGTRSSARRSPGTIPPASRCAAWRTSSARPWATWPSSCSRIANSRRSRTAPENSPWGREGHGSPAQHRRLVVPGHGVCPHASVTLPRNFESAPPSSWE